MPSAGPPLPALPEHDRVLAETADLPRRVLAADPGSSAWIHPTTGSPCAPLPNSALVFACVESSATTASAHGPERAPIGRTKHSSRCGRSIVHPVARRGSAPVYPLIGYLRGSFRPPARVWRTPGRRPAFPVPACSWRAECPDLDGQCRNGHRADARADRRFADALVASRPPSQDGIRAGGAGAIGDCAHRRRRPVRCAHPAGSRAPESGARRAVAGGVAPLGVLADGRVDMASARYARG